eukprot:TRINITY_DN14220_c0_g1_i1.p1 TRINITY_DN14220_c0_g1~~TRINITY_DN14220_c0_g1_i1.p1  ORF type:complete len:173 (-),score=25.24 TRINITY_DN14220_c0_g1_i1:104-622(-)
MARSSKPSSSGQAGPLGDVPGLVWDAERQRYFKRQAPQGGASQGSTAVATARSGAAEENHASVAQIPVDRAVAQTLQEVVFRRQALRRAGCRRGRGPYGSAEEASSSQTLCPVCLEPFKEGERLLQLPSCGHLFHRNCLEPWMARRGSCPSCRAPVDAAMHAAQQAAEAVPE